MANQGFSAWLETPQGRYVLAWEQERLDLELADIFGFNALQIGLPEVDYLRSNRMPFHLRCGECGPAEVCGDAHFLPFATNSIDLVVLPHILEFAANPHQILREVDRVLVPEGSVVIVGFNPYSLWGLRRLLAGRRGLAPWQGRYLGVPRVRDWFALLGFETRSGSFGCYLPPVCKDKWLKRCHFLEFIGGWLWPVTGAVYILRAIKRQQGMRLVMPKWRERIIRARALALLPQKPLTHKTKDSPEGQ